MKKIFILFYFFISVQVLWAVPVKNLKYSVTQPDGSILELYLTGNEYVRRLHDVNDYSVIKGDDGYYYYAINDAEGNVIPSAYRYGKTDPEKVGIPKGINISTGKYRERRKIFEIPQSRPATFRATKGDLHVGTMNNIVVFISFADTEEFTTPRNEISPLFNGENRASLKDYYKEVSCGKLTMQSSFFPVCGGETNLSYKDTEPRSTFEKGAGSGLEQSLLRRAMTVLKPQIEEAFTADELDHDGDGKVDNICFVIQGKSGAWSSLLWPHRSSFNGEPMYLHDRALDAYIFQMEDMLNVRTICHEMYHVLSAPDLYLYDQDEDYVPVGNWDLMANGSGHMSSYMKWKYANGQWISEIPEITASGRYSLKALGSGNSQVCYKIKVGREDQSEQFLLLEYRRKTGRYEKNIPESGLLVYRVMPEAGGNGSAPWEQYVYRPGGTDKQNGTPDLAALSKESGRTHLSKNTDPALFLVAGSDGSTSGYAYVEISDVSEAKSDEIYFTVTLPDLAQNVFRVKPGGTGDGSSWEKAMGSLQEAVDVCNARGNCEIWLADGIYKFSQDTLKLKEYACIYGGFTGTEQAKEERKMKDKDGNGIVEPWEYEAVSVLDFSGNGSLKVMSTYGHKPIVCNGVTVSGLTGSFSIPWGTVFSGVELCHNSMPSSSATNEGLIEIETNGILEYSWLHHNQGENSLLRQRNGNIYNCVFTNNYSSGSCLLSLGGSCSLQNCLIANNETEEFPGIQVDQSIPELINNTIVHNRTRSKSGWLSADGTRGKIRMYNTLLWGNTLPETPELDPAKVFMLLHCAVEGLDAGDYTGRDASEVGNNICLETGNQGNEAGKYYLNFIQPSADRGWQTEGWKGTDWRCGNNSAGIDQGMVQYIDQKHPDLAGNVRVMNEKADIGAYENIKKIPATVTLAELTQMYTGESLGGKVLTKPVGLAVEVTYDGKKELPVNGGTYQMKAVITTPSYEGETNGNFVIQPAGQTLVFEPPVAASLPEGQRILHAHASSGLPVVFSSSDEEIVEIREDSVAVFKKAGEVILTVRQDGNGNYKPVSLTRPLVVKTKGVVIALTELNAVYDGQPHEAKVQIEPEGIAYSITYNGSPQVPVNAGKYGVEVTITDPEYAGYVTDSLTIEPAEIQVEIVENEVVFNGTEQWPEVRTTPSGVPYRIDVAGEGPKPLHAGTYQVVATVDDPNYKGKAEGIWEIRRAPAEIRFVNETWTRVFAARSWAVEVETEPKDRIVDISYRFEANGSYGQPYWAGEYTVKASVNEVDYYCDTIMHKMVVERAPMTITLDRSVLEHTYSGETFEVTAVTSPIAGLNYQVLYNGFADKPVDAGEYEVTAEIQDYWRYQGYDTVVLHIRKAPQQITFDQQTEIKMEISFLRLNAVSSAGLPIEYESTAPEVASIEKGRLIFHQGGEVTVVARQPGNKNYLAAEPVSLTFTLIKLEQEIEWEQELTGLVVSPEPVLLTATATSGLPVVYSSDNKAVAEIDNGILQVKGPGTARITARQAGDGFYKEAEPVIKTVTVVNTTTEVEAIDLIVAGGAYNRKFKIKNVEFFDQNHLIVFNKAGDVVYDRDNYDNNFDMGEVPAGTYYYIFTYSGGNGRKQTKKGFVEVVRK